MVTGLVEGIEDSRFVLIPAASAEKFLCLVTTIFAEETKQQVDHRPQVSALLHIDLEEIPHVIQRGSDGAEKPLLLDRRRLCIRLSDDDAA